jgi:dCMP deaminase
MDKILKYQQLYIDLAQRIAQMSYAKRLQVGAVAVKGDKILATGWNGMPTGWDNNCEYREYMKGGAGAWLGVEEVLEGWPYEDKTDPEYPNRRYALRTRPEVLHAEANLLTKLARSTESCEGADLYITHAPCIHCAKLIYQCGIARVFYLNDYRSQDGIKFLVQCSVTVHKLSTE